MGKRVDDETDFEYIKYFRKAAANETNPSQQKKTFHLIKMHEALRDYYSCSLRQIFKPIFTFCSSNVNENLIEANKPLNSV